MKTQEDLQAVVDEIRSILNKHGVVLLGTCSSESIYGEIAIAEATEDAIGWKSPQKQLTNTVSVDQPYPSDDRKYFYVDGIGDMLFARVATKKGCFTCKRYDNGSCAPEEPCECDCSQYESNTNE